MIRSARAAARAVTLAAAALLPSAGLAQLSEQVDLKKPERPVPGPGEAMVVVRPWADSMRATIACCYGGSIPRRASR